MFDKENKQVTFLIYDGIQNSVFQSQVLQPLLKQLENNPHLEITLVSFERKLPRKSIILRLIPTHNRLHFVICRRLPFFGINSLKFGIYQLSKLFGYIRTDQIIARGPLAGYIAIHSQSTDSQSRPNISPIITIQARGLCAEEHAFAHKTEKQKWYKRILFRIIYRALKKVEKEAYSKKESLTYVRDVRIEAVSPALTDYLIKEFHADRTKITIAQNDIPEKITPAKKTEWHAAIREKLGLPKEKRIFVYAGSAKPWQCAKETIEWFQKKREVEQNNFLLILSQDKKNFAYFAEKYQLPTESYLIRSIHPTELIQYLSACDSGLLFRKKDIVNWVSRPTKMLEYQSARLQIIHNNTIGWLSRNHHAAP
jgi:hypothetical protein